MTIETYLQQLFREARILKNSRPTDGASALVIAGWKTDMRDKIDDIWNEGLAMAVRGNIDLTSFQREIDVLESGL